MGARFRNIGAVHDEDASESVDSAGTGPGVHIHHSTIALAASRLARLPAAVISGARQELRRSHWKAPGRRLHASVADRLGILVVQPHLAMRREERQVNAASEACRSRAPGLGPA